MPAVVPYAITREDAGVRIDWDQAGHVALFPARALRLACPCAACVEEMSGRPLLDPASVPADVRPLRLALVGAYGLRVAWSDHHDTGIYTFDRLLARCPCPRCASPAVSEEP
jgi:ATP-binding protein involved in chromosome partitioning